MTPLQMFATFAGDDPAAKIMREVPGYASYNMAMAWFSAAAGLALLVSGVGLLKLRQWARKLSIIYAVVQFVLVPASAVITFGHFLPLLIEGAEAMFDGPIVIAFKIGLYAGAWFSLAGLVYPVLLFIFMRRPVMRDACAGHWQPAHPWQVPPPLPMAGQSAGPPANG